MKIVILGLSVTSSWGNGHATTFRSLIRGLHANGHEILFLERDTPWYAANRDQPGMAEARIEIYTDFEELTSRFRRQVAAADLAIVGSFVPEGVAVGRWVTGMARGVTAFYDIDTPVTLAKLESGDAEYLTPELVRRYSLYLSFTGGPMLRHIERRYGSPMARVLYCSVDPRLYYPESLQARWDLGYLGTYSADRQPALDRLLLEPARLWRGGRFAVTGPLYPEDIRWPPNVSREIHLEPKLHRGFYAAQRFTLNITRSAMVAAGYSPSVRLFEAAACGVPIISDYWQGLETLFEPEKEILIAASADDTLRCLRDVSGSERREIAARARARVLAEHTPAVRAAQLESYYREALENFHDHLLADSARRNGRDRQNSRRPDTGSALKPGGAAPGQPAGVAPGPGAAARDLQQPAGAHAGNGRAAGGGPKLERPAVRGRQ
jgi:spore maturation protein CgeB